MSNSSAKQSSSQFDPTGKIVDQGAALRQSLIWLVGILIFVALVAWRGFVTVDHRDFDYKTLKTNEVVFRPRMPGNRTLRARIRDVTNSPPPDILFLGNHVMRGMTFGPQENGLDFRNFVIGNPSLHELSMLLKRFEGTGKLPKKAIIIGLLAHSHNHLLNDSGLKIFLTDWSKEKSINDLYKRALIYLGWKIRPLWDFRTFLNGFIGDEAASVRIDYKNCLAANAKGLPSDNSERLRLKISEFLPLPFSLAAGLVDIDLLCRHSAHLAQISLRGLRHDGAVPEVPHSYKDNPFPILNNPYNYPRFDAQSIREISSRIHQNLNKVIEIGVRNRVPIIFVIPPRYQDPGDGNIDLPMNTAFSKMKNAIIVDHRKFWRNNELYADGTHLSPIYYNELSRCLKAILSNKIGDIDKRSSEIPECNVSRTGYIQSN